MLLNLFISVLCAVVASMSFSVGRDTWGWINLFGSAANGAVVMVHLF